MRKLGQKVLWASLASLIFIQVQAASNTGNTGQKSLAPSSQPQATPVKSTEASTSSQTQILLYSDPKNGKILKNLPPHTELIPIFQQGDWVEVGNPADGQIGWINIKQYQEARENYFRPDIQTIYIHTTNDQKGKPTLNVIAYKNGQPISQQEAQKLYQQMKQEQARHMKSMQQFYRSMHHMMERDFFDDEKMGNPYWMNPPWFEPIIALPPSNEKMEKVKGQK